MSRSRPRATDDDAALARALQEEEDAQFDACEPEPLDDEDARSGKRQRAAKKEKAASAMAARAALTPFARYVDAVQQHRMTMHLPGVGPHTSAQ